MKALSLVALTIAAMACSMSGNARNAADVVAVIGNQEITAAEMDKAGGRPLHEATQALYEARVRALYDVLSAELLKREADARKITVDELVATEVTAKVAPASEGDIDSLIQARAGLNPADARHRKHAAAFISMTRQESQQRAFVSTLYTKYNAKVMLDAPPPPPSEQVNGPQDPLLGSVKAPVSVVVFSDYLCPYCRTLSADLSTLLQKNPGAVKVIYRHYGVHEQSNALSTAAMCAADQNRFHDFHNALFSSVKPSPEGLLPIAEELGLDRQVFEQCLASGKHDARLKVDAEEAQRLGVQGTPTMFINGVRYRGAIGLSRLTAAIDSALKSGAQKSARATR